MLLRHAVGATLRRIRLDSGRTLREVAHDAAISMPYLSEVERGRKEPSSEVLAGLCRALGLTILDLLREVSREVAAQAPVVDLAERREARITVLRTTEGPSSVRRGGDVRSTSHDVQLAA
jgi:transcriptional regulator with XRE-family HTH domain